jgi:hypothetical protein
MEMNWVRKGGVGGEMVIALTVVNRILPKKSQVIFVPPPPPCPDFTQIFFLMLPLNKLETF